MRLNNKENDDLDVIVMTDAGKLIFSRFDHYGNDDDDDDEEEEHLSSFCGFVQAVSLGIGHGNLFGTLDDSTLHSSKSRTQQLQLIHFLSLYMKRVYN